MRRVMAHDVHRSVSCQIAEVRVIQAARGGRFGIATLHAVIRADDPVGRGAGWTVAVLLMVVALLWPALWNGFPILFPDTAGYLARPFEGTLAIGRSALYGAFIASGIMLQLWPAIVVQAALCLWLVVLTLRVHGLGACPALALSFTLGLAVLTGLPWYVSQLMPDVLVPAAVLAIYLLAWHAEALRPWENALLGAVVAFAIASHMSILAIAIVLLAFMTLLRLLPGRLRLLRPAMVRPVAAVLFGICLAPVSNFVVTGHFAFTPGGANFLFGRLLDDGIVARYLDDACPDPTLRLCALRERLSDLSADDWLWDDDSPLVGLGGADAFEPEARRVVVESFMRYPMADLASALHSGAQQLFMVETGDDLTPWHWNLHWAIEQFAPLTLERFRQSRGQQAPFDFTWLNAVHVPIAILATVLLPVAALLPRRQAWRDPATMLATIVFVALLANAFVCGVLSTPHDRYQSRLVALAPFALALVAATRIRERMPSALALRPDPAT